MHLGLMDLDHWSAMERGVLRRSRNSHICLTCQHFAHHINEDQHTVLRCDHHHALIANGEHLTKKCKTWTVRRDREIGWAPEVC